MPRRSPRRRDLALANLNAAIWAVGNGLVSTTLVIYLALGLGAKGLAISLILASPRFAGVLRLWLPWLLAKLPRRKWMCIGLFLGTGGVLLGMAVAAIGAEDAVAWLVVAWALHHLLQYCGVILLWSWLGDLMPAPVRGRLVGARERWLTTGQAIGLLASFLLSFGWPWVAVRLYAAEAVVPRWAPLAWSAGIGAGLILLSVAPLAAMRSLRGSPSATPRVTWKAITRCVTNAAYRRLLIYSCGLAVANGVTATAQNLYPNRVLGIDYEQMIALRAMMRLGQASLAPAAGWAIDRFGARRLLVVCQLIVSLGPLFYFLASPAAPWWAGLAWVAGAWCAWTAYVGINVGLDHLKLSLAPPDNNVPSIAAYHAISDLANGVMIVAFGWVFDTLAPGDSAALRLYAALFVIGWLARTAVAGLAAMVVESREKPA